ncbi:unnamed protein product, partial [Hapterophycus canaliculatus]
FPLLAARPAADWVSRRSCTAFACGAERNPARQILQFGYVSMFAVVFPLAPLFAYLNNLWEFKLDLSQLVKTRRP